MARECPECGTDLLAEEILGITLDVCPQCAGIWFDDGELLKLKDLGEDAMSEVEDDVAPAEPEAPKKAVSKRLCPDCGTALDEFSYLYTSTVKLDSCGKCYGTWVQDGELQAMREALDMARLHPENKQLMRTLEHQLKAIANRSDLDDPVHRHHRIARFLRVFSLRRPFVS